MRLTQVVSSSAIIAPLKSVDRDSVIGELLDALIAIGIAGESVREQLLGRALSREKLGSTGFGFGVAIPHIKHPAIKKMAAAVGVSARGVDFNALDRQPVYCIFLLLSPEDQPEEHLQAMEAIFKPLNKETFRRFLRHASTPDEVWMVLEEADGKQLT